MLRRERIYYKQSINDILSNLLVIVMPVPFEYYLPSGKPVTNHSNSNMTFPCPGIRQKNQPPSLSHCRSLLPTLFPFPSALRDRTLRLPRLACVFIIFHPHHFSYDIVFISFHPSPPKNNISSFPVLFQLEYYSLLFYLFCTLRSFSLLSLYLFLTHLAGSRAVYFPATRSNQLGPFDP